MNNLIVTPFWDWFSANCQKIRADFDNTELLEALDTWVSQLGNFSWEIGPGKMAENALVISPNGNKDLLQDTKWIIECAKNCEGWEFYYAKPPRENWRNFTFVLGTDEMAMIRMDASQWEYALLDYEDRIFAIVLKAPALRQLDEQRKLIAAEVLLDGILGEETRIKTICRIDVVDEFDEQDQENVCNISGLFSHIEALISQ